MELTTKEFGLLEYFVARQGCALTRDEILNAVWGRPSWSLPAASTAAWPRCAPRSSPIRDSPSYIHTIRDIGYRFEPGGEW